MDPQSSSTQHDVFTDPTIQEFVDWIQHNRRPGVIFEPDATKSADFVPDKAIEEYFDCSHDINHAKIKRLIEAATRQSLGTVNARAVAKSCPKVFTILVLIGRSRFISSFLQNARLHDRRLPFRDDEVRLFPKLEGGTTFFDEFNEHQWQFYVENMSHSLEPVQFDAPMILPITHIERLAYGAGNSAVVYKITVHEDYDDLYNTMDNEEMRYQEDPHVYVVKSYHRLDAEKYFYAETDAFRKINESGQPVPNLIGFYGAFRQNGSFNIVLQYANLETLEAYFRKTKPPKLGTDIVTLWRNVFKLTDALNAIHDLPHETKAEQPRIFQGWHQDIKPANVLVAGSLDDNPYDVQFMLADLGLSHFVAVVENNAGPTGEDRGGDRAYSSPEMYMPRGAISDMSIQVKQKNDTWSLACVFSEVNAWIVDGVDGNHGLDNYRTERQDENRTNGNEMGNCFYNRNRAVLGTVERWHSELESRKAIQDHVTPIIWAELLRYMFKPASRRLSAIQVLDYSEEIVKKAEQKLRSPPTRSETAPAMVTSAVSSAESPPRTPPQIPPEYREENDSLHPAWPSNYPFTPQQSTQKPSYIPDLHHPGLMQSPDSLKARGSPPAASKGRESLLFSETNRISTVADEYSYKGLPSPTSAEPMEYTTQGILPTVAGNHNLDLTAHQSVYAMPHSADTQQETTTEWQAPLLQRSVGMTEPRYHKKLPSGSSGLERQHPSSGIAELPNDGDPKGKERANEEHQPSKVTEGKPRKELSVKDLNNWAEMTRASSSPFFRTKEYPLPFEAELLVELKQRDHIFVVDDAESMSQYWKDMRSLFADLIYMVKKKKLDPNGSELRFIMSDERKEARDTSDLVNMVDRMRLRRRGESNFALRLDDIFVACKQRWEKSKGKARPISLYVLTDGVWQPGKRQRDMVANSIKRMVEHLENIGAPNKMVGVQFIRFGNNEIGMDRLQWLDAELKNEWGLARDICDTTNAAGNVWKMMLGSINDYWDDDPDD
ncbi:MAG: hypothetical protein Q9227_006968 [Pyrenula ochraceoflavens]